MSVRELIHPALACCLGTLSAPSWISDLRELVKQEEATASLKPVLAQQPNSPPHCVTTSRAAIQYFQRALKRQTRIQALREGQTLCILDKTWL